MNQTERLQKATEFKQKITELESTVERLRKSEEKTMDKLVELHVITEKEKDDILKAELSIST